MDELPKIPSHAFDDVPENDQRAHRYLQNPELTALLSLALIGMR